MTDLKPPPLDISTPSRLPTTAETPLGVSRPPLFQRLRPNPSGMPWYYYVLAWGLGITYFTTGFAKSLDIRGFREVLRSYDLYPDWSLWIIATGMPYLELFLAFAFLTGRHLWLAGIGGSFLIAGGGAITLFYQLSRDDFYLPNCGCWGVFFANPLKWYTPWEDVLMVAMTVGVMVMLNQRRKMILPRT